MLNPSDWFFARVFFRVLVAFFVLLISEFTVFPVLAGKRVRFKPTTTEATSEQVVEAMSKIASHIGNAGKFSKASKLALQLLESGSVTSATADSFFPVLKQAMARPSNAIDATLRRDYQALFAAVHGKLEVFTRQNSLFFVSVDTWFSVLLFGLLVVSCCVSHLLSKP